jgi:dUTP pyrophosphatase
MTHTGDSKSGEPSLRIARLHESAIAPKRMSALAAGLDLCACLGEGESLILRAGERVLVPSGWAMAVPAGWEIQVRPRSGLAYRHGITIPNSPGTIDADYRGEVKVILHNSGGEDFPIAHGDRIAQLVIAPVALVQPEVVESVDALEASERGGGGFGSTGV